MRAWTKSVVTKVTRLHQSDCDFDFSDGFFHFLHFTWDMSQIVYLREKRRLRRFFPAIVQIKQTRLRVSFFWADFKLKFKILIPTKTTRKAATMRFVVFPLVLDCIKGSYAGLFRGFNFNHVILSLKSKLHLSFTNVRARSERRAASHKRIERVLQLITNVPHAVH